MTGNRVIFACSGCVMAGLALLMTLGAHDRSAADSSEREKVGSHDGCRRSSRGLRDDRDGIPSLSNGRTDNDPDRHDGGSPENRIIFDGKRLLNSSSYGLPRDEIGRIEACMSDITTKCVDARRRSAGGAVLSPGSTIRYEGIEESVLSRITADLERGLSKVVSKKLARALSYDLMRQIRSEYSGSVTVTMRRVVAGSATYFSSERARVAGDLSAMDVIVTHDDGRVTNYGPSLEAVPYAEVSAELQYPANSRRDDDNFLNE